MKVCATCGKEIELFNDYGTNGIPQCRECYFKGKRIGSNNDNPEQQAYFDANDIAQNSSYFWISFLKRTAIVEFVIFIIAGLIGAFIIGGNIGDTEGFLIGIVTFIGIVGTSLITLVIEMVFLNLAEDVSVIRKTLTNNKMDK